MALLALTVMVTSLFVGSMVAATSQQHYLRATFSDASNNGNFTHLVADDRTGKLYVGAVNRLYALSEDLDAEKVVSTGPKMDTPNCPPPPLECTCTTTSNCEDYQRRSRNSINKALVIDKINQRLIACFNLFQGRCEKRHLDDISQHDPLLAISLVPNDDESPVVIFIAPGPARIERNQVLYIGATRSNVGLNAYKDLVPTVSSRNLSNFEVAYSDVQSATKKQLEYQQRDLFKVYYIHGFSSGGFSYFLTVQRQSLEVGTMVNWVTKVVRVCQKDQMYYSYAEVPLQCEHAGANYNILRAAYVTRPGSNLARSLGLSDQPPITDNDDVLFALFSKSQYQSKSPTNDSVFCIYPLKIIRRIFTEIIQDCFNGVGNTGPPHIVPTEPCVQTTFAISDDYCGVHDFNNPIAGTKPVQASAILRMNQTSVTSIAVMATHQYTIAFIGTNDGHLKKVVIESGTLAKEYETIPIDVGSPVNKDMTFDRPKEHVYVMTAKKRRKKLGLPPLPPTPTGRPKARAGTGRGTPAATAAAVLVPEQAAPGAAAEQAAPRPAAASAPAPAAAGRGTPAGGRGKGLGKLTVRLPFAPRPRYQRVSFSSPDGSEEVSKVKVQNCSQYTTCGDCLGAKDPFCGWCVLEKKCGKQTECRDYDQGRRWLPYSGTECTGITNVIPNQVQIKDSGVSRLTLSIQNLPTLTQGDYECAFSGYNIVRTTVATIENQKDDTTYLMCETPYPNLLPPIPTGKDHIVMQLSVRMNSVDFVTKNFTFFDCELHSACTSCTMSDFPCTWCVRHHRCTSNQETCLSDDLITGKAVKGASDSPGPDFCPKFESSFTEILVPSGSDHKVNVRALNLQDYQSDFKCRFNIEGQTQEVSAVRPQDTDTIECNTVNFLYQAQTAHLNVPFQIFWGKRKPLDNPDRIQVVVYKCQKMADNCGECLTVHPKYNCGWCSNACTIQSQCKHRNWRNSSMDCPNPKILSFTPTSGPKEGGTRVTVEGENLGKLFDDIKAGVQVAEEPCEPDKKAYVPALRVVCVTGPSSEAKTDKVRVVIRNTYTAEAEQMFSYVEPYISDFYPIRGPQSGGTRLTIVGDHMNTGTNRTATVAGRPCQIIPNSVTDSRIVCQTSPNPDLSLSSGAVSVKFDNALIIHKDKVFAYVRDPNITDVFPRKTIMSGGIRLTVTGANLMSVQSPKIYITVNNQEFTNDCTVKNDTWMLCRTPNIAGAILHPPNPQEPLSVPFGFHMDNVKDLLNYTHTDSDRLRVYDDPKFNHFKDGTKRVQSKEDDHLTITGSFLALAMTTSDVTVKVGAAECKVTSLSQSYLICTPPGPDEEGVGINPKVTVHVGTNFNYTVGKLKYESMEILSLPTIIGIGAGGGILILIIIIVCIAYRQKSRESDRVMKRMQNQMDVLEARVAKECKEAFAELQTDMSELTSDLSGPVGIPFRDYRSFCMHVLFPIIGEVDHAVIRPLEVDLARRDGIEKGLRLFNSLVLNKTFLLLFIRTLEYHKNFSMRERVNVASLISVALQGRMEHHTDILKTLLADLIERSMEDRGHPKLLLRRTESVAEKMLTNWFTFLLYKFLKECAGEPLFMLYRAIKQQVDKGPVDVFTGEAKYSLSEDKLIRQQIDYRVLTIHVIDPDVQYGSQEHAVKVLDCDTIAQVKEKILDAIYKNAPHSSRPDKDDLDLEWRTGVKGRLILQDEDVTSKAEGDFKRINTLSHYKVSDMALMALIPKQSSMYNLSFGSDRSGSHHRFDTYMTGSPSLTRPLAPHTIHLEMENGAKYYHLVKSHDSELQKEGDRGSKMVSEIYLTRLLATKGTLQQFVDDLFETIFSTANRGSALPLAIKYMFDFLDDQALHHGISDPEVVHTWKSNSLPLRFWVNVVKNPDFVFDIHKSNIVDSCLSVVAQTFMDSCSMSEHRLGKDSPSSKLLYAKDIPKYKRWVERYYQDIKLMPAISEQDMNAMLAEESRLHQNEFNINAALYELYQYVARYNDELMDALTEDEFARNYRLSQKLEQVHSCMDSYA